MKKVIYFVALFLLLFLSVDVPDTVARTSRTKSSDVYVRGYYRKDGTYVSPHYRSAPDGIKSNNYSCIDYGQGCGDSYTTSYSAYNTLTNSTTKTIIVPKNATLSYDGGSWFCNVGYALSLDGLRCEQILQPTTQALGDTAIITRDVNLRIDPSTSSDIVQVIDKGSWVQRYISKTVDGIVWYYIKYKGVEGWVHNIGFTQTTNMKIYSMAIIKNDVNLRNKPGIKETKVVQVLKKGSDVRINGSETINGILRYSVLYGETEGWIHSVAFE